MSNDTKNRYHIEALGRGLRILEAFTETAPSLSLTELAQAVDLDKSTVFRFAHTLEALGYLYRDAESKRYRPGVRILRLGMAALNSLGLQDLAGPFLKALSLESGETTNMSVRDGSEIVYIARNPTQQIVNINLHVGSRLPVYCTSMGKAQLIDLSRQELVALLGRGPFAARAPNTITHLDQLLAELESVRHGGYAINDEELATGLRSVAAPVRDGLGQIVAAINVSVPGLRVSRRELEVRLAPMLIRTAHDICAALGAAPGPRRRSRMPLQVEVRLMATLRRHLPPGTRGSSCRLEVSPGSTAGELLSGLGVPNLESHVVLVNGRDAAPAHVLADGDIVAAFPALAGG
jgi:IclR family pca regulon transcriptional regulator